MISAQLLKQVLLDQEEELKEIALKKRLIERDLPRELIVKNLRHPNIVVITGVRRCGKSVLATQVLKGERFAYVNFDDERFMGFEAGDFSALLSACYECFGDSIEYFIFDEIQNIPGWELFLNRLRRTKKVIVTGSNAKLLSRELATHLTGRYAQVELWPFSFREYLRLRDPKLDTSVTEHSTKVLSRIRKHFTDYCLVGGFPETYELGLSSVERLYSDVIEKDILVRHRIRNFQTFKKFALYLLTNYAKEASFNKLRNVFDLRDTHTVSNYFSYLSSTYLLFILDKYSPKLKMQHLANKKIYCIDHGLLNHLAFSAQDTSGRLLENIIFIELQRRKAYYQTLDNFYFWQSTPSQYEVDFVLRKGKACTDLLQVSYDLRRLETMHRETRSLLLGSKEMRCKNLSILTLNEENTLQVENEKIFVKPIWKYLLQYPVS